MKKVQLVNNVDSANTDYLRSTFGYLQKNK